jgi:hypothetical protein
MKFAAATGPQQPRGRITDDVVDGPAIAERALDCPAIPAGSAGYQESTLRRADKYRDRALAHCIFSEFLDQTPSISLRNIMASRPQTKRIRNSAKYGFRIAE